MATFRVKLHDTTLPLTVDTDLTGASVKAFIRSARAEGQVPAVVPVNVTDPVVGAFDLILSEVGPGEFDLEVLVEKDGEQVRTPSVGFDRLVIGPNLDDPLAAPYVPSATLEQVIEEKFAGQADLLIPFAETAQEAAADAGVFAAATEFDANRAGESAFQSGQSAGYALGHRNAAKASADAAVAAAASIAKDVPGGVPGLDGDARVPDARMPERLSPQALNSAFVAKPAGGDTGQALVKKADGTVGWGIVAGGGQNIRLDALAAGQRAKSQLTGNLREPAAGASVSAITPRDATSLTSIGTASLTSSGNLITTSAAHGLVAGDPIAFGTMSNTTGITAGDVYFVLTTPTATTLTVSTSVGGSTRTISADGTAAAVYRRERGYLRQTNQVNPALRVTQTRAVQATTTSPRWEFISQDPSIITYAPGTGTYTNMRIDVEYEGDRIGVLLRATSGLRGTIYIDGRKLASFTQADLTAAGVAANTVGRIGLLFTTKRRRLITLEFDGLSEFAGFDVTPGFPLIYPTASLPGARFGALGDSFFEGEGSAGTGWSLIRWLGHLMGWANVWKIASGGVGAFSASSSGRPAVKDWVANVAAQNLDGILIGLGINDREAYEANPAPVIAAHIAVWEALIPTVREVIILGPWPNGGGVSVSPSLIAMDADLAAAARARGLRFISPIQEEWQFTRADTTHPDAAGHEYLAWRLAGHLSVPFIAAA